MKDAMKNKTEEENEEAREEADNSFQNGLCFFVLPALGLLIRRIHRYTLCLFETLSHKL